MKLSSFLAIIVAAACVPYGNVPEQIAPYEAQLTIEHARATFEERFGSSDDFYLTIEPLPEPKLGLCRKYPFLEMVDPDKLRELYLHLDKLNEYAFPEAAVYYVALHEIVHVNTTCDDQDHREESMLMRPHTSKKTVAIVADIVERCGWDYKCLAAHMFDEKDVEYVETHRR